MLQRYDRQRTSIGLLRDALQWYHWGWTTRVCGRILGSDNLLTYLNILYSDAWIYCGQGALLRDSPMVDFLLIYFHVIIPHLRCHLVCVTWNNHCLRIWCYFQLIRSTMWILITKEAKKKLGYLSSGDQQRLRARCPFTHKKPFLSSDLLIFLGSVCYYRHFGDITYSYRHSSRPVFFVSLFFVVQRLTMIRDILLKIYFSCRFSQAFIHDGSTCTRLLVHLNRAMVSSRKSWNVMKYVGNDKTW